MAYLLKLNRPVLGPSANRTMAMPKALEDMLALEALRLKTVSDLNANKIMEGI